MGFASGTVSFRRYHINGKLSAAVDQRLIDRLQEHAFGRAEHMAPDGSEVGWIAPTHLFDTHMDVEKIAARSHAVCRSGVDREDAPAPAAPAVASVDADWIQPLSDRELRSIFSGLVEGRERHGRAAWHVCRMMPALPVQASNRMR